MEINVYQDGNTFYDDGSGDHLFTSPLKVTDYDLTAAKLAREEFLGWFKRERPSDKIVWVK